MNGRQITSNDEIELHKQLKLSFLDVRRKRHIILKMMYDLKTRKPELVAKSTCSISLRSNNKI